MIKEKQLDLVLINPGNRTQIYQSLGSELSAIEPPIWAGLLASFARCRGVSVEILDANAENLTPEETASRVVEMNPLLTAPVIYGHNPSASTQVMPSASSICSALKEQAPQLPVLMVGGHVAALPERTLRDEEIDFVSGDEGLFTIVDLLGALKSSQPKDFSNVSGLWYWDEQNIVCNPAAALLKNLDDEIGGMPWELLPMHIYRAHNWHCFQHLEERMPYASLYTTLGCPYHCSYCCIHAPFKRSERVSGISAAVNSYRFWTPESIIAQLDLLVNEYGVKNIKFADEMFVLNRRHVEDICDHIIARGYDLNIWAYARVDTVKDGMADKLIRAGFNWLCFGIESGSERVRDDVHKSFDQEDVYETIRAVRQAGINVIGNYMFGLPEDDVDSMQATLDLALELNCEFANFYSSMAYPGSQLYEMAEARGWPLPANWSGYSQHSIDSRPLPTQYLSGEEVLSFRDQAFQQYFDNPGYLDMVEQKFGAHVRAHIEGMASHKLEREHANSL